MMYSFDIAGPLILANNQLLNLRYTKLLYPCSSNELLILINQSLNTHLWILNHADVWKRLNCIHNTKESTTYPFSLHFPSSYKKPNPLPSSSSPFSLLSGFLDFLLVIFCNFLLCLSSRLYSGRALVIL